MSRYQQNILWLGLILITLNIIVNYNEFKAIIFGGGPSGDAGGTSSIPAPSNTTPPATNNPVMAPGQLPVQPQTTPTGIQTV